MSDRILLLLPTPKMSISYSSGAQNGRNHFNTSFLLSLYDLFSVGTFLNPLPHVDHARHPEQSTPGEEKSNSEIDPSVRHCIVNLDGIEMEGYEAVTVSTKFNLDVIYQVKSILSLISHVLMLFIHRLWPIDVLRLTT